MIVFALPVIYYSLLFLKLHPFFSPDKKVEDMFPDSSKREEVVTVDVSQAKILLQSDHQYLDVRYAHHHYISIYACTRSSSCWLLLAHAGLRKSFGEDIVLYLRSSTFPTCSTRLKVIKTNKLFSHCQLRNQYT